MAIRVTPEELAADLQRRASKLPRGIKKGILSGIHRGRTLLTKRTPVDRGQMKASWRAQPLTLELINDAPHAGIIEGGARPHKVNKAGRESLERWAMRQLQVDVKTAKAVAQGVINKLAREGQKGKFIVRDAMPELQAMVKIEVERLMRSQAGRKA